METTTVRNQTATTRLQLKPSTSASIPVTTRNRTLLNPRLPPMHSQAQVRATMHRLPTLHKQAPMLLFHNRTRMI